MAEGGGVVGDLEAPRARYKQVAERLREDIRRGVYEPGATLPSQPELAKEYGINQSLISRAMGMLQAEGLIRTEHGRGSVVLDVPQVKRVRRIDRDYRSKPEGSTYSEELSKAGVTPRAPLVHYGAEEPPGEIAEALNLDAGEKTLVRKRHMFADEKPVQIAISYIPMNIAGTTDFAMPDTGPSGMYARLAERGYGPIRFSEDIEVRGATEEEAEFLDIAARQPVFTVLRTAFDADGRAVESCMNVLAALQWRLQYSWNQEDGS